MEISQSIRVSPRAHEIARKHSYKQRRSIKEIVDEAMELYDKQV